MQRYMVDVNLYKYINKYLYLLMYKYNYTSTSILYLYSILVDTV